MNLRVIFAFVVACTVAAGSFAQNADLSIPRRPKKHVTDRASVLTDNRIEAIETKLADYKRDTTNEIVVYVDDVLPAGTTIEEFANGTFNFWGLGQKGKNNGVLFMLFTKSRKLRIEVGDGLASQLTNDEARTIIGSLVPHLRQKDYATAIDIATDAMITELGGGQNATTRLMDVRQQLEAREEQRRVARQAKSSARYSPPADPANDLSPGCLVVIMIGGVLLIFLILLPFVSRAGDGGRTGNGPSTLFTSRDVVHHHHHYDETPRDRSSRSWFSGSSGSSSSSSWGSSSGGGGGSSSGGGGGSIGGGGRSSGGGASGSW